MKKIIDFIVQYPVQITIISCFIFYFLPFQPKPFGDNQFHTGTQELIQYFLNGFEGRVSVDKGFLTLFCYLFPYSIVYSFHNNQLFFLSGILFNCIFICYSIYLLFKTFDLMGIDTRAKGLTFIILCLFPIHIYYAMGINGEAFAFFAVAAFVYNWIKIGKLNTFSTINVVYLGLSLVLLYGIKPTMVPFIFGFTIFIYFTKINRLHKILFTALILMIPMLGLLEKHLDKTNYKFKNIIFRSHIVWSRYELRGEPFNWVPQHGQNKYSSADYMDYLKKRGELDSICTANNFNKTHYFAQWVINDIASHPFLTMRQYFLKFFQSQSFIITPLLKSNKSPVIKYGIHIYINIINYLLVFVSILGMILLFKTKNNQLFIPFLMLWGWSLIYIFILHSEQRYMFPMRPILIFLFAYTIHFKFSKIYNQNAKN